MKIVDRKLIWLAGPMFLLMVGSIVVRLTIFDDLRRSLGGFGLFALQLIPFPFAWLGMWPRNKAERLVMSNSPRLGMQPDTERRYLQAWFAPLGWRRDGGGKGISKSPYAIFSLILIAFSVLSQWLLPFFAHFAAIMLLRRSAYAGNVSALWIEARILRLHYPNEVSRTFDPV